MLRLAIGCVALLVLTLMAFVRSPAANGFASGSLPNAATLVPKWDDSTMYHAMAARLENCASTAPDIAKVVELVKQACLSAEAPLPDARQELEWQVWSTESRPGQRVKVKFSRGTEQGKPATRITLGLLPTGVVPSPFQPQGSVIDVKAVEDGGKTEIIGVVAYGVNLNELPFDEGEPPPPLTFGHHFRIAETGDVYLIRYFSKLTHENGGHQLINCYGSGIWEFKAPHCLGSAAVRDLAALISNRVPASS